MNIEYFTKGRDYIAEVNYKATKRTIPCIDFNGLPPIDEKAVQLIELPPHAFIINFDVVYAPLNGKALQFAITSFKMCVVKDQEYWSFTGLSGVNFFGPACLGIVIIENTPLNLIKSSIQRFWTTYFGNTSGIKLQNRITPHWRATQITETDIQQKIDRLNRT